MSNENPGVSTLGGRQTMTAPYTHEYCIPSHKCNYIHKAYCEPVTSNDWYYKLPTVLYGYMLKVLQTLKHQLINHLPLSDYPYGIRATEEDRTIKNDFEKLYNKYLKN